MTPYPDLQVKSGVQLIGERGNLGSRPTLYFRTNVTETTAMLDIVGNDVEINGIHFVGPKPPSQHANRTPYLNAVSVIEDFDHQLGRRVLIDDNEFNYSSAAPRSTSKAPTRSRTSRTGTRRGSSPSPRTRRSSSRATTTCTTTSMDGGGYGVVVGGGATPPPGQRLRLQPPRRRGRRQGLQRLRRALNYVLDSGTKQGSYYNQHFDVHGVGRRRLRRHGGRRTSRSRSTPSAATRATTRQDPAGADAPRPPDRGSSLHTTTRSSMRTSTRPSR